MKKGQSESQQGYRGFYRLRKNSGKVSGYSVNNNQLSTGRSGIRLAELNMSLLGEKILYKEIGKDEAKVQNAFSELRLAEKGTQIFYELREPAWIKALFILLHVW